MNMFIMSLGNFGAVYEGTECTAHETSGKVLQYLQLHIIIFITAVLAVLEWLVRLLNLSFDMGVVPTVWRGACMATWYVADAKSVWSWRKIVESSAEFLCRY